MSTGTGQPGPEEFGGRPGDEQRDDDGLGDDAGPERDWDRSVRTFDPEVFNVQWSGVRAGVDYGPGNLAADVAADVLRGMYRDLTRHSVVDRVLAMTDLEGNPFVHVWLSAAGALEAAALAGDGRRLRGEAGAGVAEDNGARARPGLGGGRGDLAAYRAAGVVRGMCRWVSSRSALDRVQAMKDLDGTPLVYVCMNAAGVLQLAALVRDGRRMRRNVADEVR